MPQRVRGTKGAGGFVSVRSLRELVPLLYGPLLLDYPSIVHAVEAAPPVAPTVAPPVVHPVIAAPSPKRRRLNYPQCSQQVTSEKL